jgi:hypothetical protein
LEISPNFETALRTLSKNETTLRKVSQLALLFIEPVAVFFATAGCTVALEKVISIGLNRK